MQPIKDTASAKMPPEAENRPSEGTAPAEAAQLTERYRLFLAERPTLRERLQRRRWWRLTLADWAAVLAIVVLSGIAPGQLLRLAHTWPPTQQPWGEALALALAAILGALAIYTMLRRQMDDLRQMANRLGDLGREATGLSRSLIAEARDTIERLSTSSERTATVGHQLADAALLRIEALEGELAARRAGQPAGPDLYELARRSAAVDAGLATVQALAAQNDMEISEVAARLAETMAESAALQAEFHRQDQRRRQQLDATDQQILDLLTADPGLTDEEIGRHPKVALERSQVTRRRNKLAAAGYPAAQKRQGQRPGTR